jgi:hypothetical protein
MCFAVNTSATVTPSIASAEDNGRCKKKSRFSSELLITS